MADQLDVVKRVAEEGNDPAWEVRFLRRRLRQNNLTMGRQGQAIYDLRCQVAELREMIGKENRGYYRRLETSLSAAADQNAILHGEIDRLREKLNDGPKPPPNRPETEFDTVLRSKE
jgi:hypothetical protein